jgi:hypothetical protein
MPAAMPKIMLAREIESGVTPIRNSRLAIRRETSQSRAAIGLRSADAFGRSVITFP